VPAAALVRELHNIAMSETCLIGYSCDDPKGAGKLIAVPRNQCPVSAMTPRQRETFPPVTLRQIRGHGCRNLLVYCESLWCNHSAVMSADGLPDEMPVRSLCPRMVCTACGLIGADVRPDWSPRTNRRQS
jgi:hypothetical protein